MEFDLDTDDFDRDSDDALFAEDILIVLMDNVKKYSQDTIIL